MSLLPTEITLFLFGKSITVPILSGSCEYNVLIQEKQLIGASILFRKKETVAKLSIPIYMLSTALKDCKTSICLSSTLLFRPNLCKTNEIFPILLSYTPCLQYIIASVYQSTHEEIKQWSLECIEEYTKRPIVYLDLDKTLYINERFNPSGIYQFHCDYIIKGQLATRDEPFKYRMTIRPGAHEFLYRLMKLAHVFLITSGDLHYAKHAVHQANERQWLNHGEVSDKLVSIPIEKLYSVRTLQETFSKSFSFVMPFQESFNYYHAPIFAIDDSPQAWLPSLYGFIIQIKPFEPNDTSRDLLDIIDAMESLEKITVDNLREKLKNEKK